MTTPYESAPQAHSFQPPPGAGFIPAQPTSRPYSSGSQRTTEELTPRADVRVGVRTDVGMCRDHNEDYYGYFEPALDSEFHALGRLLVVCDGVGGYAAGEIASRLATETIIQCFRSAPPADPLTSLKLALENGGSTVWKESQEARDKKGMGTTVVSVVLKDGIAHVAHCGDSRLYLFRNGAAHQVTIDHSLVQQLVIEGFISEEEAQHHPKKNVIFRSLGLKAVPEVDVQSFPFCPGDVFLLASDGLTGLVRMEECLEVVNRHQLDPQAACVELIGMANARGGDDNITVMIAQIAAMSPQTAFATGYTGPPSRLPTQDELIRTTPAAPPPELAPDATGTIDAADLMKIRAEAEAAAAAKAAARNQKRGGRLARVFGRIRQLAVSPWVVWGLVSLILLATVALTIALLMAQD